MRLILGSKSPRRHEILSYFSIPFEQISSNFDEEKVIFEGDPEAFAKIIAIGKANDLATLYPEAIILTADTVVYKSGKVYGKPIDEEEAAAILSELQGSSHMVYTAVCVISEGNMYTGIEETKVYFNPLTPLQIHRYLQALHWADKAGGYSAQLAGSLIMPKIEGSFYNVMGLPIHTVAKLLKDVGIDLWDYLK